MLAVPILVVVATTFLRPCQRRCRPHRPALRRRSCQRRPHRRCRPHAQLVEHRLRSHHRCPLCYQQQSRAGFHRARRHRLVVLLFVMFVLPPFLFGCVLLGALRVLMCCVRLVVDKKPRFLFRFLCTSCAPMAALGTGQLKTFSTAFPDTRQRTVLCCFLHANTPPATPTSAARRRVTHAS